MENSKRTTFISNNWSIIVGILTVALKTEYEKNHFIPICIYYFIVYYLY